MAPGSTLETDDMADAKLVVYTAITGACPDTLRVPTYRSLDRTLMSLVRFVCVTDSMAGRNVPPPWTLMTPLWEHESDPRRTARYHKVMAHEAFPDAQYSLWCDGSYQLLTDPWWMVSHYLQEADLAVYRHPQRKDPYAEAKACAGLRKDNAGVLRRQVGRYSKQDMPKAVGLMETANVLRRHTPAIAALNQAWWQEIKDGSVRDQVSLPYVVWKLQVSWAVLAGSGQRPLHCRYYKNQHFGKRGHYRPIRAKITKI